MNILHYTLGIPPYRTGGLIRYSIDLLLAEQAKINSVFLIYPGKVNINYPKKKIKKNIWHNITTYEIQNPVNIPLLYGVKRPLDLMGKKHLISEKQMDKIYNEIKPDIFHIHTLMGLPYELVSFFSKKNVKIIYTSHDYYGLCLKVNFIDYNNGICNNHTPEKCALCNKNSPSNLFLRLRNSRLLLTLKSKISIKKTPNNVNIKQIKGSIIDLKEIQKYQSLLEYYQSIFKLVYYFHFNSIQTQNIYNKYLNILNSKVIPISHANIQDYRKTKKFDINQIRLGFIGNLTIYKGFPLLKKTLLELKKNNFNNWNLKVFSNIKGIDKDCINIHYKGKYTSSELKNIFDDIDLLIVPSIWKETFSFVTLEAISYGVPVLVSSNVGAKDIVKRYDPGFVYDTEIDLYNILSSILKDISYLIQFNKKILDLSWNYSFDQHVNEILDFYNKIINENSIYLY